MKAEILYGVYRGEEFVTVGTQEEVAKELGVKASTVYFWSTPTYKKRLKKDSKALISVRLEDD